MSFTNAIKKELHTHFSSTMLSVLIIGFALFLIFLAITVKSPWAKAGILAWEILP